MSSTHLLISNPWRDNNNTLIDKKLICKEQDISDKLAKVAKNELREDERTRQQCLQQFRDWIKKNQDIENCFMGEFF
jgi:hypothetical protein